MATKSDFIVKAGLRLSSTVTANASSGTAGQVLTSGGSSANAYWATIATTLDSVLANGNTTTKDLSVGNLTAVSVFTTGNVGVGTSSPATKLEVSGQRVRITNASDPGIEISNATAVKGYLFYDTSGADVVTIRHASNTGISVNSSGNVGIGTSSPSAKLDISGGALGTTAGNQVLLQRLNTTTTNGDVLEITKTRTSDGSSWQSAGYRLQQRIDATWMGYIQLNGDNNNGGISFGTGTSTTSAVSISERMRIDSSGNTAIGSTSAPQKLYVAGNMAATGDVYSSYSDDNLKINLGPIKNALDKVDFLTGFYYRPNEIAVQLGEIDPDKVKVGVSAQKVQQVLPEVIAASPMGEKYLTVQYEKLVPLLIEAIKELKAKVDKLEQGMN